MNWPTSQDYNEAVQDAANYSDPALKRGEVVTNALGLPVPRSGNFADVYQFKDGDGKMWALKCFTRKVAGLRERYAKIDEHLGRAKLPFTVGFKFMEQGIQVKGEWFPLLKMEWVEGFTLNDFVSENISKPQYLHALMQMWAKLAGRLRDANMAHADLQHGNVLLVPGATPQKLGLKLIDYDGMWVPALSDYHSGEVGHPNYQHPLRLKDKLYNGDVDRFPHLVVAAGLRATVVGGNAIWDRFDNGDNLLFKESDLRDPANARVFKALWELNDPVLRTLVGHIALSTKEPMRKTPWLDDILFEESGPKLTGDQEKRVCEMLGVTSAAPAVKSAAQAKVEQEFNVFEFLDDDDEPARPRSKSESRRPATKMMTRPKRPQAKSKLPLIIGGGAVAVVLVIGGVIAAMSLGKKDKPTEVVQKKDKDEGEQPKPPKKEDTDVVVAKNGGDLVAPTKFLRLENRGYVTLANSTGLLDPNKQFTVELWIRSKPGSHSHTQTFFRDDNAHTRPGVDETSPRACGVTFHLGREQNGKFPILFGIGANGPEWNLQGPPHPIDNNWHHLAVCKATNEVRIFRDGRLDSRKPCTTETFFAGVRSLSLGVGADGHPIGTVNADFRGFRVSNSAIYLKDFEPPKAFPKTEQTLLLLDFSSGQANDIRDVSGHNHHGTIVDGKWMEDGEASPVTPQSAIGVAALPGGREYLFIRQSDPALYMTVNGSARKAREVGRHGSPIRTVAAASDGARAITGSEDGEIRIWNLNGTSPDKKGEELGATLNKFKKIELFKDRFSFDAYEQGIIVHDHEKNQDATIRVGMAGHPVKGAFKSNLNNADNAKRFGEALTDEVKVFNGELIVQVFEGGAQFLYPTVNKSWFGWHRKRQPSDKQPEAKRPLTTKVSGPTKFNGFKRDYEFTLYREGILIRDVDANKEETLNAGAPVAEKDGKFEGNFAFDRLNRVYGAPVTVPTKLFGGDIEIVLCKRGFFVNQVGTNKDWNMSSGREVFDEPAAPEKEPKRADFVWLDDAIPAGAKVPNPPNPKDVPWVFVGKKDGPVHSGEKSVKLTAAGGQQNTADGANPGIRVGEGDVLFAHVYLDPKNPPEQIMIKLRSTDWVHHSFWGADKIQPGNRFQKMIGPLPEPGKWVRLEFKAEDVGLKVGMVIKGIALTQFGGTAYWDTIGINTQTPQGSERPETPKSAAVRVVKEHTAAVVACAISTDGSRAVSVGKDKNLCEWNLAEGKLVRKFNVPDPQSVAFLPDGKNVLLGTVSESAGIWDLEKQSRVKHLEGHRTPVRAVAVAPNGDLAFTGAEDSVVRWSLPEGRKSFATPYHNLGATALAISPDGMILACAGPNSPLRFFDPRSGKPQGDNPTKARSLALAFLSNTAIVAARDPDPVRVETIRDDMPAPAKSGAFTRLFEGEQLNEGNATMRYSPDGKTLFVRQKEVAILEGATGKELKRIELDARENSSESMAFGNGDQFYRANTDGKFQHWDWRKGEKLKEVDFRETKQPPILSVYVTPDPNRLLVLNSAGASMWWDVATWKVSERFTPFPNESCIRAAVYPDGKQIAFHVSAGGVRRLAVWDVTKKQKAFDLEEVDAKFPVALEVSPNGKWIVGHVREEGKAFVWDGKTGKRIPLTCIEGRHARGGFISADHYVICDITGRRVVIDLSNDRIIEESPQRMPGTLAANAEQSLMASFDTDRRLRIWRIEIDGKKTVTVPKVDSKTPTPKEVAKDKVGLIAESEVLSGAALLTTFSGDGKKIFVVTQGGTVHVLDAVTLKEKSKFEASKTRITHVAAVQKTPTGALAEKLYLLDDERHVSAWDPEKGVRVKQWNMSKPMEKLKTVHHFIASTTDSFLMIFDNDSGASIAFDTVNGTLRIPPGLARPPFNNNTNLVAFTPDAKIGTANASRKILVWTVSTGNPIRVIEANFEARWMGLVSDANTVAAASRNQLIVWNYTTGTKTAEITDPNGVFGEFHLAASLKGNYVLTAGRDQTLRVWDVTTGKEAKQWKMEWLSDGITISHDGKFAAVWHNAANKVSLWAIPKVKAAGN